MSLRSYRAPRQQSAKAKAVEAILRDARPRVFKRDEWKCRIRLSPDCTGRAEDLHHTKMRSGGWSVDEMHADDALIAACRDCHKYVHAHPAEARELGLIVSRYR